MGRPRVHDTCTPTTRPRTAAHLVHNWHRHRAQVHRHTTPHTQGHAHLPGLRADGLWGSYTYCLTSYGVYHGLTSGDHPVSYNWEGLQAMAGELPNAISWVLPAVSQDAASE